MEMLVFGIAKTWYIFGPRNSSKTCQSEEGIEGQEAKYTVGAGLGRVITQSKLSSMLNSR